MAQLVPKLTAEEIEEAGDITKNLESLSFEGALSEAEKAESFLRTRAHALTVIATAQSTYLVSILTEARAIKLQLKNPNYRNMLKLMQALDKVPKEPIHVGLIGCGRLGSHIAHCLLTIADLGPDELQISTRRPETLGVFREKGVRCCHDNSSVAAWSMLLFICVLPSHLPTVLEEIRDHLSPRAVIYCLVQGVTVPWIVQKLGGHTNIVQPQYTINYDAEVLNWDESMEVATALSIHHIVEQSCPLTFNRVVNGPDNVIHLGDDFFEVMTYAIVNLLLYMEFTRNETMLLLNTIMLGDSPTTRLADRLAVTDISRKTNVEDKHFPMFNLSTLLDKGTPLEEKFTSSPYLCQVFVDRYCSVFLKYFNFKVQLLTS